MAPFHLLLERVLIYYIHLHTRVWIHFPPLGPGLCINTASPICYLKCVAQLLLWSQAFDHLSKTIATHAFRKGPAQQQLQPHQATRAIGRKPPTMAKEVWVQIRSIKSYRSQQLLVLKVNK